MHCESTETWYAYNGVFFYYCERGVELCQRRVRRPQGLKTVSLELRHYHDPTANYSTYCVYISQVAGKEFILYGSLADATCVLCVNICDCFYPPLINCVLCPSGSRNIQRAGAARSW